MKPLTEADLLNDLAGYIARAILVEDRLAELPIMAPDWKAKKKLEEKRRVLNQEIKHVDNLIKIAQEALEDPPF